MMNMTTTKTITNSTQIIPQIISQIKKTHTVNHKDKGFNNKESKNSDKNCSLIIIGAIIRTPQQVEWSPELSIFNMP